MLSVDFRDPVLFVTLNRPEVRNAFNDELIGALTETFSKLPTGTRAVVLTGEGVAFCAGGDLQWMRRAAAYTKKENFDDAMRLAMLFGLMQTCEAAVIARVNGAAFGGGCGLVAAADIAIASSDAKFAFSEVRLGLIPATIAPFVLNKIGHGHARALFTTGETFDAQRAFEIGLVHQVVEPDRLEEAVCAKLNAVLAAGPRAVVAARNLTLDELPGPDETARRLATARAGDEGKEGVAAFLEEKEAKLGAFVALIKKLLIANRGEIAVRIIRTARELGIVSVVGHSEADAGSIAVAMADEAVCLGPAEAASSYLNIQAIVEAAKTIGAQAIHPGYGFLSERAELAEACEEGGIKFVGPPSAAMRKLGSKISSKALAEELGVPLVPGFYKPGATDDELASAALRIGFPVMLKASAGGGGRGMRTVHSAQELPDQLRLASEEALKAFGDGAMMVEKLIERPRHIEAQVLADQHGGVAVLFERECSLQRRHQKVIEETPSPFPGFIADIWPGMRKAVETLITAAGYAGAGTVEFMVDAATGNFYFLEVNTRLQVEHPVTEAVTGLDLVAWQLRIASGERLPESVLSPQRLGHAIEARIIAEDPGAGFMPSVGEILAWAEPQGPGIRVDAGFGAGQSISRHYDSLLAKLIVHAEDRPGAIRRLRSALLDFHVLGVKTNIPYLLDVVAHPAFKKGAFDTGFLEREFGNWVPATALPEGLGTAVANPDNRAAGLAPASAAVPTAWDRADGFRIGKSS